MLIKKLDWKLDLVANPQIRCKRFTYKEGVYIKLLKVQKQKTAILILNLPVTTKGLNDYVCGVKYFNNTGP